jgi:hypothetical protein
VLAAAVPTKFTNEVSARASATVVPAAVRDPDDENAVAEDNVPELRTLACSGGNPKPIKSVRSDIYSP